jgi:Lytic transglycolase
MKKQVSSALRHARRYEAPNVETLFVWRMAKQITRPIRPIITCGRLRDMAMIASGTQLPAGERSSVQRNGIVLMGAAKGRFRRQVRSYRNDVRASPLGTHLRVSDPRTGRSVVVTVNDRGPFMQGRVLDLSLGAARALGMIDRGVMLVSANVL